MTNFFKTSCSISVLAFALSAYGVGTPAFAQNQQGVAQDTNTALPPVTIEAPVKRRAATQRENRGRANQVARRAAAARRAQQQAQQPSPSQNKSTFERASGPINGYVASGTLSGTKTNTSLLETPQSISVVGREQIADQGSQTLVEALRYTAGVSTNTNPNDNRFDSLVIRGFQPVLYLDGMQLPYGSQLFGRPKVDPFMLERVEVLKGPSSSLYGQIAPGGLVNMVSLMPTATSTHTVEFKADSFGQLQTGFDFGGPLNQKGDLLYRITGVVHGGGTQIDNVDDFRGTIAPSFTWRPDLDTTFTFLSSYQRDHGGVEIQFLPAVGTLYANPNGKRPISKFVGDPNYNSFDRTQYWVGYQFEHHVNDTWTVRQNLRYAGLDTDLKSVVGLGLQGDLRTLNRATFHVPENSTAFTLDNQAEAKFNTGSLFHTALIGLDYRHATSDFGRSIGGAPTLDMFNPWTYVSPIAAPAPIGALGTTHTTQAQDQTGIYLQDQIALGRWRVTLSGRHDWVSTDTNDLVLGTRTSQNDAAFSYRAGINYLFDSGLAPYFAYSKSFQPLIQILNNSTAAKPTTGEQYEAGIKYQPPGTNILMTAVWFDITQQNIVTTIPILNFAEQTAEGRSRGFEFETVASLTDGLKLIGSYTYTDTENTKTYTANQLGKHFITVPLNQAALWADYTFQSGQFSGFGFGGGVRYIGTSYGDAANTISIPDYTLFDAALHYDLGKFDPQLRGAKIALNVNNIFNKEYVATCASLAQCYYGTGRLVTGSLRYSW